MLALLVAAGVIPESGSPPPDDGPEPISLSLAKLQLRVTHDTEDELIRLQISAARGIVEKKTGQILTSRIVAEAFDDFDRMQLRAWPIAPDASPTVTYLDIAGVAQTYADARLTATSRPARLLPAVGSPWPATMAEPAAVIVTVEAGYAAPDEIPEQLKVAMLAAITNMYENRSLALDEKGNAAVSRLCAPYRRRTL